MADQGTQFESGLFEALCRRLEIKHLKATALHPQSNGKSERFVRFTKASIATLIDDQQSDWDTIIDCVLFAYRTTINTKTNEIPFYLLYGRDVVLPTDLAFEVKHDHNSDFSIEKLAYKFDLTSRLMKAYRKLAEKRDEYINKYKDYYVSFEPNDLVMIYWPEAQLGMAKKFLPNWRGPFKVKYRLTPVTSSTSSSIILEPFKKLVKSIRPSHASATKAAGEEHPTIPRLGY